MTKDLSLLVAADINENSSKLVKARKLGVKVVELEAFLNMPSAENSAVGQVAEKSVNAPEKTPELKPQQIDLFALADTDEETPEKNSGSKGEQLTFGF